MLKMGKNDSGSVQWIFSRQHCRLIVFGLKVSTVLTFLPRRAGSTLLLVRYLSQLLTSERKVTVAMIFPAFSLLKARMKCHKKSVGLHIWDKNAEKRVSL